MVVNRPRPTQHAPAGVPWGIYLGRGRPLASAFSFFPFPGDDKLSREQLSSLKPGQQCLLRNGMHSPRRKTDFLFESGDGNIGSIRHCWRKLHFRQRGNLEKREGKSILSLPAATDASDELPGVFDGAANALAEHEARVHRPELVVDRGPAGYVRRLPPSLSDSESECH